MLPRTRHRSYIYFFWFQSFYGVFIILFIQYYNVICRPSDHTVGRPRAEIRTQAGRPRGRDTTPRPPHLLKYILRLLQIHILRTGRVIRQKRCFLNMLFLKSSQSVLNSLSTINRLPIPSINQVLSPVTKNHNQFSFH